VSRNSEYLNAACWAVFGVVIVVASWRLDRLANLDINPWSVPGLTPGLVGALIILLAIALGLQARRAPSSPVSAEPDESAQDGQADNPWRSVLAGILCFLFAGVSLGRGVPFVAEGAVFIFVFIVAFSWPQWRTENRLARGLLTSLAVAVAASAIISWLFESVFLVRLP
jgi:hypothetical protein